MFDVFIEKFDDYLIETNSKLATFFIPGNKLIDVFSWYGRKRAEAFKSLSCPFNNDIEERDKIYHHMIIWDNLKKELVGGQRILFNKELQNKNKNFSYLEYYHPGSYEILNKYDFCEIGRTFVMPNYQGSRYLLELIRGFVRIPESKNINLGIGLISFDHNNLNEKVIQLFLNTLRNSNIDESLKLPEGRYIFEIDSFKYNEVSEFKFNFDNLNEIEIELRKIDKNFRLPMVLKPYMKYCNIKFEGYSIAKDYNNIIQLIFSGKSENINDYQRKLLKPYSNLNQYC